MKNNTGYGESASRAGALLTLLTILMGLCLFAAVAFSLDDGCEVPVVVAAHGCRLGAARTEARFLSTQLELVRLMELDRRTCGLYADVPAVDFTRFRVAVVPAGTTARVGVKQAYHAIWIDGETVRSRTVLEPCTVDTSRVWEPMVYLVRVPTDVARIDSRVGVAVSAGAIRGACFVAGEMLLRPGFPMWSFLAE